MIKKRLHFLIFAGLLAACTTQQQADVPPTATLAPIVSMTPRFTATPVPSRTPLPTFTFTPSNTPIPPTPSDTFTPTVPPPVIGIVNSIQAINVREGPGTNYRAFQSLKPGTGVQVIGQNPDGTWYNVKLEDDREGWISAEVLRLRETATPFPTLTPSPAQAAIVEGTPLPTAIIGGGTVTPTPPRAAATPTPFTPAAATTQPPTREIVVVTDTPPVTPESGVPVVNMDSINMTATALAFGIRTPTPSFTPAVLPTRTTAPGAPTLTPRPTTVGGVDAPERINVFALCDDPNQRISAPSTVRAGMMVDVWWGWFATSETLVQQHLAAATYEIRVDGTLLTDLDRYRTRIMPSGAQFVAYWYVPFGPLAAGEHKVTYKVTWSSKISDGFKEFGPGTSDPVEESSCTFTVRE